MSTWVLPHTLLTWSFILCRGSHCAATRLRVISSCEPSFLRSASVMGVDFLGANPRTLITDFLPWGCIYLSLMGRIYTRVPPLWRGGTSRVRFFPLLVLELMALKPPFFVTVLNCRGPKPPCDALSWAKLQPGDAPCLAMPFLGDASAWQWLERSICWLSSLGPSRGPTMCWLWPLVNARRRDGTVAISVFLYLLLLLFSSDVIKTIILFISSLCLFVKTNRGRYMLCLILVFFIFLQNSLDDYICLWFTLILCSEFLYLFLC